MPCARTVCGLRPPSFQGASYNLALFVFLARALLSDHLELELELIQTQMTQKPMLRVEVGARALRNQTGGGGGWGGRVQLSVMVLRTTHALQAAPNGHPSIHPHKLWEP